MNKLALIVGLSGIVLTKQEKIFLKKENPWGVILFSRNIQNILQLKKLIIDIKKTVNDKKYPILIDEEGGKVSRISKIVNLSNYSQEYFGKLYLSDKKNFLKQYNTYINIISYVFNYVGININTVPVLDVRRKKSHTVIGSRSFSTDPKIVSKLGKICIKNYYKNKIFTVVKHIPGHGLSLYDSHFKTPTITLKSKELTKKDFKPFNLTSSLFAMTGHIIYNAYDKNNTATHSKIVIKEVIRKKINFKGILISDDITMKSLKYSIEKNALMALESGCNLALHCNGKIKQMKRLAKVVPKIDNFTEKKTSQFYKFLG
jgi:beta-N-acetylhexosaminidase